MLPLLNINSASVIGWLESAAPTLNQTLMGLAM